MLLLLPWGGEKQAVASQFMFKRTERSDLIDAALAGVQNVQKGGFWVWALRLKWLESHVMFLLSQDVACGFFFCDHRLLLTLFPPEYSEPKDVSSSAPVEEPSWSLSLLFLKRFGRLGPLKSWKKKKEDFFTELLQTGSYSFLSPVGTSKGLRLALFSGLIGPLGLWKFSEKCAADQSNEWSGLCLVLLLDLNKSCWPFKVEILVFFLVFCPKLASPRPSAPMARWLSLPHWMHEASPLTYIAGFADVGVRQALLVAVVEAWLSSAVADSQQVSSHVVLRGGNLCIEKREVSKSVVEEVFRAFTN